MTVDWLRQDQIEPVDPRVVRVKESGLIRLTFVSHLRLVRCGEGRDVERIEDVCFAPQTEWEEYGVEGSPHYSDQRPLLVHLRGRISPRRSHGPGVHGRFSPF